ncbi:MAG: AI-2E family transporter, partial [Nanoarchaeota archaeon]|nr:AI-2E family transporter [Nanoarchaeota archaeon]
MKKMLRNVAKKYVDSLAKSLSGDEGDVKDGLSHKKLRKTAELEKEQSMIVNRLPGYFLIASIIVAFYLLYMVIEPFFTTLILAAVLTVLFYGVYRRVLKSLRGHSRIASILMCLMIVLIIIIPLAGFVVLLTREGLSMYETISTKIASGALDPLFKWEQGGWLFDVKLKLEPIVNLDDLDLKGMVVNAAQNVSSFLVSQSAEILKNIGWLVVGFVIMLFSMFYLFKDGDKLVDRLIILSPLPRKYEKQIVSRINDTVKGIAFGVFLTAIIQGTVAGIGYAIAGLSNPVFWGAATGLFSLIPLFGTGAIWLPAAIIVFLLGNYAGGIFLVLWGLFLVGTIDNLVRPYLI